MGATMRVWPAQRRFDEQVHILDNEAEAVALLRFYAFEPKLVVGDGRDGIAYAGAGCPAVMVVVADHPTMGVGAATGFGTWPTGPSATFLPTAVPRATACQPWRS
jgi:hypothetical protein